MFKKRYIGISLLVLIVCGITLLYLLKLNPFSASMEKPAASPVTGEAAIGKKSLTAMEALLLAYEEAKKISQEELLLIDLRSTDDTDSVQTINDGADGRRTAWNFSLGSAKGNISIAGDIRDGKCNIVQARKDDNNSLRKGIYHISDIKIDSPEVVQKAIKTLNMQPGNPLIKDDWVKGYHFAVYGALTDSNSFDTLLVLRVTGISPNSPNSNNESLRMNVFFDGRTGEMVSASEQVGYDQDGRSMWRKIESN
ncbi:MAG: hypothetical protein PHI70_04095 [Proteiniphilum sp.]|nr:hypothetical protein [Proteiniphilum sp.]MDD3908622.1 hypothetical protein [Proteiniphilum sp.]MDD4415949.1 hypothetical protein [Proteiniphilum sp.]